MYSMSAFSDLWTSVDGMLVLTSVSTPPLGLLGQHSVFHIPGWRICACCWDSSPGCSRCRFFAFWGTVEVQVSFVAPILHSSMVRSVWWLVALLCPSPAIRRGSEPQSDALFGPFRGWGPGAVPPWLWPTRPTPQWSKDNCTAMLLIRRQPIFYLCQVGCVIRFWQLGFLLRVASSPRITALSSWRVHPTQVCVLRFCRIDSLSFRTYEHHLPDCYDLRQGVALFRLQSCWESQFLLFHLICCWGLAIWHIARYDLIHFCSRWDLFILLRLLYRWVMLISPLQWGSGALQHPYTPAAMRRHCIGLAMDRLCTDR